MSSAVPFRAAHAVSSNTMLSQPSPQAATSTGTAGSDDPYSFIYDTNSTVMSDSELQALRELYPSLTDEELKSNKNPGAVYQLSVLRWNLEQQSQEAKIRANEMGLTNIRSNIFGSVNSIFEQAMNLARQNRQSEALQLIQSAAPVVSSGISSLSGIGTEGVDEDFITGIQNQYAGLSKSINEMRNKVLGVNLTDEDLLRTTGLDLTGRTETEHRQAELQWQSLSTISDRDLDRESPFLAPLNTSPSGFDEFHRQVEQRKQQMPQ